MWVREGGSGYPDRPAFHSHLSTYAVIRLLRRKPRDYSTIARFDCIHTPLLYLPTYQTIYTHTHKITPKMLFSTLIPITLLAASAAAYPTSESSGQHIPGVPAPVTAASSFKVCERACFPGQTECQAGWVCQFVFIWTYRVRLSIC